MYGSDILSLLPLEIVAGGAILIMVIIALFRNHGLTAFLTLLTLAVSFISLFYVSSLTPNSVEGLIIDTYGLFFSGVIQFASFVVVLMAYFYLEIIKLEKEEFYVLLLISTLGSLVLAFSRNFVTFFLGIEVLSIALYTMVAYLKDKSTSIEAGLKYLILAAASSAFLLFGMALVYSQTGSMDFVKIMNLEQSVVNQVLLMSGFGLIIVGIGFKLALVPFHMWAPDVYEGAPAPVTAFIATVSKAGVLAVVLRFFIAVDFYAYPHLLLVLSIIAMASMLIGNILALLQRDIKRVLAYSSIAHLGYILVALIAGGRMGAEAVTFYIVIYIFTLLCAFGIISFMSSHEQEAKMVDDYSGLYWRNPWLAAIFTTILLSLAGIPLTAGFIGKYYILMAGVNLNFWFLVITLVISSVIGLYYYLRIIVAMMSKPETATADNQNFNFHNVFAGGLTLGILALLIVYLGVYPTYLFQIIHSIF